MFMWLLIPLPLPMDVGDATSTTSMDVVKVGLENQVGLELGVILG